MQITLPLIFSVLRSSCKNFRSLRTFIIVCLRLNLIPLPERTQSRAQGVTGSGGWEKSILGEGVSGIISVPAPSTDGERVCVLPVRPRSPPGGLVCGTAPQRSCLPCLTAGSAGRAFPLPVFPAGCTVAPVSAPWDPAVGCGGTFLNCSF